MASKKIHDWGEKDPDETIKYGIDMRKALAPGDSLATVAWSFVTQAGLTKSNEEVDGTFARVTLADGADGLTGKLEAFITTAAGEELTEIAKLKVKVDP